MKRMVCATCLRAGIAHCNSRACPWRRCIDCSAQWSIRTGERLPIKALKPPVPPEDIAGD